MLETILKAYDDLALEIQELENTIAIQAYKEKLKELLTYEDKIKKAIKDGADIDGTEHFEFCKQYVRSYNYETLEQLLWSEKSIAYLIERTVSEFDKDLFEKDMKLWNLPEEAYGCVEKWQCRISVKPRKTSSYSL